MLRQRTRPRPSMLHLELTPPLHYAPPTPIGGQHRIHRNALLQGLSTNSAPGALQNGHRVSANTGIERCEESESLGALVGRLDRRTKQHVVRGGVDSGCNTQKLLDRGLERPPSL